MKKKIIIISAVGFLILILFLIIFNYDDSKKDNKKKKEEEVVSQIEPNKCDSILDENKEFQEENNEVSLNLNGVLKEYISQPMNLKNKLISYTRENNIEFKNANAIGGRYIDTDEENVQIAEIYIQLDDSKETIVTAVYTKNNCDTLIQYEPCIYTKNDIENEVWYREDFQ